MSPLSSARQGLQYRIGARLKDSRSARSFRSDRIVSRRAISLKLSIKSTNFVPKIDLGRFKNFLFFLFFSFFFACSSLHFLVGLALQIISPFLAASCDNHPSADHQGLSHMGGSNEAFLRSVLRGLGHKMKRLLLHFVTQS